MKTLVVIDVQRDFFCPEGSLYVKGGETLPAKIAAAAADYDAVVFTLDWHPGDHCSFAAQDGPWPPHCVAFTQGAGLADEFSVMLADGALLHFKGTDPGKEQYGGFEFISESDPEYAVFENSDTIEICGIAGDYCVKETAAVLMKHWPEKIVLLPELIASIDDGTTLRCFIEKNNLKTK